MQRSLVLPVLAGFALTLSLGCGGTSDRTSATTGAEEAQQVAGPPPALSREHGHKAGSHGGTIVAIGRDNYHAEAVIEKGGLLRLYMLGQDESRLLEVEAQFLTAHVKPEEGGEAVPVPVKPEPQEGDAPGKTSRFVASLPRELWSKDVVVTLPNVRINGERFRIGFTYAAAPHADAMPASVAGTDEERDLFLKPGGRYTIDDIKANGSVVASERYRDFRPMHDLKPKVGDRICPITLTKANAKCTWVVAGQTYEFCCPPCIEEFVKLAKEQPDDLQPPDSFRKK
jgi:hypothetical protein